MRGGRDRAALDLLRKANEWAEKAERDMNQDEICAFGEDMADWSRDYWCRWRDAEKERPEIGQQIIVLYDDPFCLGDVQRFDGRMSREIKAWLPLPGWKEK